MNSTAADFECVWQRMPGNAADFHESDLARLCITPGTHVEIVRGGARLAARAAVDNGMRPMPWWIARTDLLSINRMPVITGIDVRVEF